MPFFNFHNVWCQKRFRCKASHKYNKYWWQLTTDIFFRELPNPLLTYHLYDKFVVSIDMQGVC